MTTPSERIKAVLATQQAALDVSDALAKSTGGERVLIDRMVLERMAAALRHLSDVNRSRDQFPRLS